MIVLQRSVASAHGPGGLRYRRAVRFKLADRALSQRLDRAGNHHPDPAQLSSLTTSPGRALGGAAWLCQCRSPCISMACCSLSARPACIGLFQQRSHRDADDGTHASNRMFASSVLLLLVSLLGVVRLRKNSSTRGRCGHRANRRARQPSLHSGALLILLPEGFAAIAARAVRTFAESINLSLGHRCDHRADDSGGRNHTAARWTCSWFSASTIRGGACCVDLRPEHSSPSSTGPHHIPVPGWFTWWLLLVFVVLVFVP